MAMSINRDSVRDLVKTKQYFEMAKEWYFFKYIEPLSHRSLMASILILILLLIANILSTIYSKLPLHTQIQYLVKGKDLDTSAASIIMANQIPNSAILSISEIIIKNYIDHRESYDYDRLKRQFTYIKNSSTNEIFDEFYKYYDIDNPISPILRYRKRVTRNVKILSVTHEENNNAKVIFETVATEKNGKLFEKIKWEALVGYEIDSINLNLPTDSRFNFKVTEYQLKLLEDMKVNSN